jgi:hypothetical protein
MARQKRIRTFEEFWPFYVRQHSNRLNRQLHLVGTSVALSIAGIAIATKKPKFVKWALLAGYGPAWIGHLFIEKNRPATWRYPLWSIRGDLLMWRMALSGTLESEVERILRETEPPVDDGGKGYVHIADHETKNGTTDRDTLN